MEAAATLTQHADSGRRNAVIGGWLLAMCVMVFVMVVLGGLTRLTQSGLSIVDWRPISGWLPPLSDAQWADVFEKYQQFPEYRQVNAGMELAGFKSIFLVEYVHRVWGRLIGVAFLLPFLYFLLRGWVARALAPRLTVIFVLGAAQGGLGWYMVQSGLIDRPDVSQYRLTAHLAAALAIYGYMFWVGLTLLGRGTKERAPASLRRFTIFIVAWIFLTMLSGGFVAGLDAGLIYNTFPLMDGGLAPAGLFTQLPWYANLFENVATVQFDHRVLAESLVILIGVLWWRSLKSPPAPGARLALHFLGAMAFVQLGLGIATLLLVVPVSLASLHQAGALVLLTFSLWAARELT